MKDVFSVERRPVDCPIACSSDDRKSRICGLMWSVVPATLCPPVRVGRCGGPCSGRFSRSVTGTPIVARVGTRGGDVACPLAAVRFCWIDVPTCSVVPAKVGVHVLRRELDNLPDGVRGGAA